ncbi:MAG: hypothetical protein RSC92_03810 [Clostridia bacterium]
MNTYHSSTGIGELNIGKYNLTTPESKNTQLSINSTKGSFFRLDEDDSSLGGFITFDMPVVFKSKITAEDGLTFKGEKGDPGDPGPPGPVGPQGPPGEGINIEFPDWLDKWVPGFVQIGDSFILSPKIFAGTKNETNQLTGVLMGDKPLEGIKITADGEEIYEFIDPCTGKDLATLSGIIALHENQVTVHIDASSGDAFFKGTIQADGLSTIDPSVSIGGSEDLEGTSLRVLNILSSIMRIKDYRTNKIHKLHEIDGALLRQIINNKDNYNVQFSIGLSEHDL